MSSAIPLSQLSRPSSDRPSGALPNVLLLGGLLLLGHLPLLVRFFSEQWGRPQYQFFPLMIVAAGYVAWQRLMELRGSQIADGSPAVRRGLLIGAFVLLVASIVLWSGRGAAVAMLVALAGLAWSYGGWLVLRAMAPAGFLLAIIIGPPGSAEETILQRLREVAVWLSGTVLIWLDVPHLVTGTVIEIRGQRLLVAEACSGINSLMAVVGFTFVLCFLKRHRAWRTTLLLALAMLFAIWVNVGRITLGVWLRAAKDVDILSGQIHEWTSIILFCAAMALVLSSDSLMSFLRLLANRRRVARESTESQHDQVAADASLPAFVAGKRMWLLAGVFAVMGVGQVANAMIHGGLAAWFSSPFVAKLPLGVALASPPELAGWKHAEADEKYLAQPELEGKRSQGWLYKKGNVTAVVAMDFPFSGFHDLMICYQNAGWTVNEKTVKLQSTPQGEAPYVIAAIHRLNEYGYSWFGAIDEQGSWVEPPATTRAGQLRQRLQHIGRPDWNAATYQIQLWVQGYEPLTEQQRQDLESLYLAARAELARQLLQHLQGGR